METPPFPEECNSTGWNVSDPSVSIHHPDISDYMWIYFGTCVFVVGVIGNSLTLVVMTRDDMRGTSTSAYLVSMAIVDILLLVVGMIPEWLNAMGIVNLREVHPVGCKLSKFLEYTFGDAAVWIIVLFTIDRCIAICDPFKRSNCCSPGYAKFYSIGALLVAFVKNAHVFWTRGAEKVQTGDYDYRNCVWIELNGTHTILIKNCGYPTPEYAHFETYVRPWIAFALVNVGPFCVIFVCNLIIIHAMIRMKKLHAKRSAISHGQDKVFQTTAMCLAASISFLVCVTPSIVLLIGKPYWSLEPTRIYVVFKSTNDVFYYVNYSANFFLYCLTGQKFRETLLATLLCQQRQRFKSASSVRACYRPRTAFSAVAGGDNISTRTTSIRLSSTTSNSVKSNSTNSSSTRSREDSIPEYNRLIIGGYRQSVIPESDGDDSHV